MKWRLCGIFVLTFGAVAVASSARAGVPEPAETPAAVVSVPPPVLPNDCAAADAEITRRLQPSLTAGRALPTGMSLGDALASLYKARALCKEGAAARGMLVYIRLADALADAFGDRGIKRR